MKFLLIGSATLIACGPGSRSRPGGGSDGTGVDSGACSVGAEGDTTTCADGIDNDCDGLVDCNDPNCSGVGACPVCGMVQHPLSQPLALPDGIGGHACTNDASCASVTPGPQRCFDTISINGLECRQSYTSSLHFTGFAQNQTFNAISNIQKVCVNMEHSWMRDLEIDLVAPDGKKVALQKFAGQSGSEIYLGQANDSDTASNPVPGVGADYCWTPTAVNATEITYANNGGSMLSYNGVAELPPGDYQAADPWSNLLMAPLNGDWELVVTDLWPQDNGYIFSWSIAFDPMLVQDCSGPVIQ